MNYLKAENQYINCNEIKRFYISENEIFIYLKISTDFGEFIIYSERKEKNINLDPIKYFSKIEEKKKNILNNIVPSIIRKINSNIISIDEKGVNKI